MSPLNPVIFPQKKRREIIRENILGMDYKKLAKLCRCTTRTIIRDVQQWRREGGFEEFLLEEFMNSYPTMKIAYPERAFDRLCFLLGKTITHKVEQKTTVLKRSREDINVTLKEYSENIERASNRNLQQNNTAEQVDST